MNINLEEVEFVGFDADGTIFDRRALNQEAFL
jgi:hypothetical protein